MIGLIILVHLLLSSQILETSDTACFCSDDKNIERLSQETYSALQISFMLCLFLSCYSDLVPYQCLWFTDSFSYQDSQDAQKYLPSPNFWIKLSIRSVDISINSEMILWEVSCFRYTEPSKITQKIQWFSGILSSRIIKLHGLLIFMTSSNIYFWRTWHVSFEGNPGKKI